MYKSGCIALLSVLSINIKAQSVITGNVKNQENKTIPYCAIGIKDSKTGAITDGNGNYKLEIPDGIKDKKIIFSAAGYMDKVLSPNELKSNSNVVMDYKVTTIEAVVMGAKKMKEKTVGQKSRPFLTFSKMFDQNVPTIEQGNVFPIYQKTRLVSYNFYVMPSSKFEQITLKLNIYSVKNNQPDRALLQENIIHKTSTTGWQKIDLSDYKLNYNNLDKIAVTLQLVDHKALPDTDFVFGISAKKRYQKICFSDTRARGTGKPVKEVLLPTSISGMIKLKARKTLQKKRNQKSKAIQNSRVLSTIINTKRCTENRIWEK